MKQSVAIKVANSSASIATTMKLRTCRHWQYIWPNVWIICENITEQPCLKDTPLRMQLLNRNLSKIPPL